MEMRTISAICDALIDANLLDTNLEVCWHLGEPLAAGLGFYEQAFSIFDGRLRPHGVSIAHTFQTNGILINSQWCELFRETKAQVGLSLDGPKEIHDSSRRHRSKNGTHKQVMAAVDLLRSYNIDPHIICVLGNQALDRPKETLDFFVENDFSRLCFNIEETEGIHRSATLDDEVALKVYRFFRNAAETQRRVPGLWIRELWQAKQLLKSSQLAPAPNEVRRPFRVITVLRDGEWSTLCPELAVAPTREFIFGRVVEGFKNASDGLDSVCASLEKGVSMCRKECAFFPVCGGGTPSNKYYENGTLSSSATRSCTLFVKPVAALTLELSLADRPINRI